MQNRDVAGVGRERPVRRSAGLQTMTRGVRAGGGQVPSDCVGSGGRWEE